MKVVRQKSFSWFESLFKKKTTVENNKTQEVKVPESKKIVYKDVKFIDGCKLVDAGHYDNEATICTLGLYMEDYGTEAAGKELEDILKKFGVISENNRIIEINRLLQSDNVNGSRGADVYVVLFEKPYDRVKRMVFGDKMKTPEDFFYSNNYYTWYKSGKDLK